MKHSFPIIYPTQLTSSHKISSATSSELFLFHPPSASPVASNIFVSFRKILLLARVARRLHLTQFVQNVVAEHHLL